MEWTSLVGAIQDIAGGASRGIDIVQATVKAVEPYEYDVEGDQKLRLPEQAVTVPSHIAGKIAGGDLTGGDGSPAAYADEKPYLPPLQVGDKLYLLAYAGGSKYFVLGRA